MKRYLLLLIFLPLFANGQVRNLVAQYPISAPSKENLKDGILGRWKFKEDTNKNNFYEIIRGNPYAEDKYHIKFWDRGGKNPSFESNMHFSKIGDLWFINVPYFERDFSRQGYFFLKVIDYSSDFTKLIAVVYHDNTLWDLSQEEVTRRITQNANISKYYTDTVHLFKILK